MKRSDFDIAIGDRGWWILYRGHNVGGLCYSKNDVIPRKDRYAKKLEDWHREADREISDILEGHGLQEHIQKIEAIDKMLGHKIRKDHLGG